MSERERFEEWLRQRGCAYSISGDNVTLPIMVVQRLQARADLAEQREAELVEAARALSTAVENIDGDLGGVDLVSVYAKADHLDAILAKFKPEGAEGA